MKLHRLAFFSDSDIRGSFLQNALSVTGWRIEQQEAKRVRLGDGEYLSCTLIVIDLQNHDMMSTGMLALPPVRGEALFGPPVLALVPPNLTPSPDLLRGMVDACISSSLDPPELRAALEPWRPDDAGLRERLLAVFGHERLDPLLEACGAQLAEALGAPAIDAAQAHRLAGLTGTLGFARSAAAWRALADGDDLMLEAAHAAARQAIWTIAQSLAGSGRS